MLTCYIGTYTKHITGLTTPATSPLTVPHVAFPSAMETPFRQSWASYRLSSQNVYISRPYIRSFSLYNLEHQH